jgi:hypothetical protein
LSKHIEIQDSENVGRFIFSKTIMDLDLFKNDSVKELFDYINNKDAELKEVKFLVRQANKKLKIFDRQLFIRKSSDKEVENRICVTRR